MRSLWWLVASAFALLIPTPAFASEADIVLPNFAEVTVAGMTGNSLFGVGIGISLLGLVVGFVMFLGVQKLPVHKAMKEISELIYETCKTYVLTQARFIAVLWILIAIVVFVYFGLIHPTKLGMLGVVIILAYSILGILGSVAIAWFGMRVNNYANSASAFAALRGKPYPAYSVPLQAGMAIGLVLISMALLIMLVTLLVIPSDIAGACFIGFAIGTSLGASALRIAGGIFTKIADVGSDLMKIVFKIKEDDARNPGVIADCAGDNAGDSVGPTADGFETYGVTAVALITFIMLAVAESLRGPFVVWIFTIAAIMILTSLLSYGINWLIDSQKKNADKMDFEAGLTRLIWITAAVSIAVTFGVTNWLIGGLGADLGAPDLWWKMAGIMSCGTLAGALIPEVVKVFTSMKSGHVKEIVDASRQGPSLNVLSGIIAGNYAAYWLGISIMVLMGAAFLIAKDIPTTVMQAPGVFAFGLLAFGFLSMGPVTIAVDSYGPVTDNAQSVYELSLIEQVPNIKEEVQKQFGFTPDFEKGKHYLEENDGAGNTFKATAKPVLIGTAVVGATTMIFSIMFVLTNGLKNNLDKLSLVHAPFLLGLIMGGAVIYWFTGASMQAVSTGAYRAVEFIKKNMKLDGATKASTEDSKKVVEICTTYAQRGMLNIFLGIFFSTLAFACVEPFFFIGYLISIAIFGLYQAIFMADAGGAWDNAKKLVEVELKAKGTPLHDATVVGDTVGDPFKDTSSVALNPVIKFTTLFGLLAVELAVEISHKNPMITHVLAVAFFVASMFFVYRSFYGMRIEGNLKSEAQAESAAKVAA
jgi:K(+)-stimulated pyrophosphate-energized sodium pump